MCLALTASVSASSIGAVNSGAAARSLDSVTGQKRRWRWSTRRAGRSCAVSHLRGVLERLRRPESGGVDGTESAGRSAWADHRVALASDVGAVRLGH